MRGHGSFSGDVGRSVLGTSDVVGERKELVDCCHCLFPLISK